MRLLKPDSLNPKPKTLNPPNSPFCRQVMEMFFCFYFTCAAVPEFCGTEVQGFGFRARVQGFRV